MIDDEKEKIGLIKVTRKMVSMTAKACPIYFTFLCATGISNAVFATLNIVCSKNMFESAGRYASKTCEFKEIFFSILILAACLIMTQITNGLLNFVGNDFCTKVGGRIEEKLNMKSSKISPVDFENPRLLDDINKAEQGQDSGVLVVKVFVDIVTFYIPSFIFTGIYFYSLSPVLVLSIFIIFIPTLLSQVFKIKLFAGLEDKAAPVRRKYNYYEKCMTDKDYFKETRLLGGNDFFKNAYKKSLVKLNEYYFETKKRSAFMEFSIKLLTLGGYVIVLLILVKCVLDKSISIAAFAAVFNSLIVIVMRMREIICTRIGIIFENIGTAENFIRFLDIQERKGSDTVINGVPEVIMNKVSFAYPGNRVESISNVSIHINSGETVAIVGENGAGKSTLVRLLTGIYLPDEGSVTIDGHDTRNISMKSLFNNTSGVFQKFQKYKMTLGENVSISDTESGQAGDDRDVHNSRIGQAINKADLEVSDEKFLEGYDTMLSREFDGIDLSGGQWQRVAIARGFYKKHNMIVLDEPTAAIDPIEETKLYKKFKQMSQGKTAVIVTHRLGSAKIADKIVVLDKGKIVQIGTHDELINKDGKYKEMYEAQSKWYKVIDEKV
ncbi:ABC transporter ATP-binding protein [Inconstantimicrobium porci]|uniref:ABC transporter ATP-binding protein n=1 Tax=Inconstantimicrobium porci TaxID=2652291 RepID=UPI00240A507A|nr:ABC transporter ATP-binding protein [Inconstantimicrobium porci]MDD6769456.1 ABC transporter ATP-binding protein [Inconstantimicrobium porci]